MNRYLIRSLSSTGLEHESEVSGETAKDAMQRFYRVQAMLQKDGIIPADISFRIIGIYDAAWLEYRGNKRYGVFLELI